MPRVSEIEPREMVDRALHRVVSFEPAEFAEDEGRIVLRVKRGFLWRDQVLRPEEVVAKRFGWKRLPKRSFFGFAPPVKIPGIASGRGHGNCT